MTSELILGGDYYYGDLVVGEEHRVGTIKIGSTTYDRYVKVIDFGALPNATTKNVAHGITGFLGVISIKGTSQSNAGSIPVPHISSSNISNSLSITMSNTSISITAPIDYSHYTQTFVTLEYYK